MQTADQSILDDINWWRQSFESDEQCREKMIDEKHQNGQIAIIRTKRQLEEDGDGDEGIRSTDTQVFQTWRSVMLNCSTVTLTSSQQCTVCLPFTTLLKKHVFDQDNTIAPGVIYRDSAGWLARALAQSTEVLFKETGDACSFRSLNFGKRCFKVVCPSKK